MKDVFKRRTRSSTNRQARKKLNEMVNVSKNQWIEKHCDPLNRYQGTNQAWGSLKALKCWLSPTMTRQMKKTLGFYAQLHKKMLQFFIRTSNNYTIKKQISIRSWFTTPVQYCWRSRSHCYWWWDQKSYFEIEKQCMWRLCYTTTNMKALTGKSNNTKTHSLFVKFWSLKTYQVTGTLDVSKFYQPFQPYGNLSLPKNYRGIIVVLETA